MSNTTQNLNEATFAPDFGKDSNGIAYSCGHIDPLQRAIQDAVEKIKAVQSTLTNINESLNEANDELADIADDFIDFSNNRLEAVREINKDLRYFADENAGNQGYISDLESDKEDLNDEIKELNNEIKQLNNKVENLTTDLQALEGKYSQISKKFEIVKGIIEDLDEL